MWLEDGRNTVIGSFIKITGKGKRYYLREKRVLDRTKKIVTTII